MGTVPPAGPGRRAAPGSGRGRISRKFCFNLTSRSQFLPVKSWSEGKGDDPCLQNLSDHITAEYDLHPSRSGSALLAQSQSRTSSPLSPRIFLQFSFYCFIWTHFGELKGDPTVERSPSARRLLNARLVHAQDGIRAVWIESVGFLSWATFCLLIISFNRTV